MGLADAAIIGLVGLLIACVPAVPFLYRARRRRQSARQNESLRDIEDRVSSLFGRGIMVPVATWYSNRASLYAEPSLFQDGIFYTNRTFYRETSVVRPSATPNPRNPLTYPIVQTNVTHGTIYEI